MKHHYRIVSFALLLWIGLMLCVYPMRAANEVYDVWDGNATAVSAVGHTYTVSSAAELAWIAQQNDVRNGFAGDTIALAANIDLNGSNRLRVWTPIGTSAHPFAGVLEGNHHLVRGLASFNAEDGIGLFGHVDSIGQIKDLGLSGGRIVAVGQRRVGALVGVCEGSISGCWSMVEIAMAGNMVGGLVGDMRPGSTMTDSYCCAFIRNAGDTLGVLVGRNAGALTRVYTTGYAKNGCAFVGVSRPSASYTSCYYDRKLYFQEPGVLNSGIVAIDNSREMFGCMEGEENWTTNEKRYPELTGFVGSDASNLSVVAIFLDTVSTQPVNHANDLTENFEVDTLGVKWKTQDLVGAQWIKFNKNQVVVVRPCSENDVLTTATINDENRTIYFRPRRLEELKVGSFDAINDRLTVCWETNKQIKKMADCEKAEDGWGEHHYMVVRFAYDDAGNLYPIDTICRDKIEKDFLAWYNNATILGDSVGDFVLRAFVHDERCVPDWIPCEGECPYTVLPEFNPGKIPHHRDTIYLNADTARIHVPSLEPASGGDGRITYQWRRGTLDIDTAESLDYKITSKGFYRLRRNAKDSSDCGNVVARGLKDDGTVVENGAYEVLVYDSLNPGALVALAKQYFCSLSDAKAYTIEASPATGGSGAYMYQWYNESGSTLTPIPGATGCNLALKDITLEVGVDYKFVRMVKDSTRFTQWKRTGKEQMAYVMHDLNPGAIESEDRGRQCLKPEAGGKATFTVTINETSPASAEEPIQYRWLCKRGDEEPTIVGTTASLTYTFTVTEQNSFIPFTYTREVKKAKGNCDWIQSAGSITEEYGLRDEGELTKTICGSAVPYTMTWKDSKGQEFTNDFTTNGQQWKVTDEYNAKGCPADTIITVEIVEQPAISSETEAKLCQNEKSDGEITVYFKNVSGDADMFYISYSSDFAKCMGRPDTTGYISAPGTIIIRNVPPIPEGDHYLYVHAGVSGSTVNLADVACFSEAQKVNIIASLGGYVRQKFGRVLFVDNNPDNGEVPAPKLHFKAYQWYKNGIELEGQTGQYYHENGELLKGVYYARLTGDDGKTYRSCDIEMLGESANSSAAPGIVYPVPVGAGNPLTVTCYGGSVEICSFTGDVLESAECPGENVTILAPRVAGIYYVRITHNDGSIQTEKLIVK